MGLRSVTSLPGSADGVMRSGLRVGPMIGRAGRGVARANLTARQAKERGLLTSGTFGLPSTISSRSATLASSSGSRLRQRLATAGSTLFKQTWKEQVTPSGRTVWLPVVSGHRTKGNGCTSWPTTKENDARGNCYETTENRRSELRKAVYLVAWSSPRANKWGFPDAHGSHEAPIMAGTPAQKGYNEAGNNDSSRRTVALVAGWVTPNTPSGGPNTKSTPTHTGGMDLEGQAQLASPWATPTNRDHKDGASVGTAPTNCLLGRQVWLTDSGPTSSGSLVKTEGRGQLNPAFSLWLQGFPTEWALCAARVTRSSLNAAKRLSKRT